MLYKLKVKYTFGNDERTFSDVELLKDFMDGLLKNKAVINFKIEIMGAL